MQLKHLDTWQLEQFVEVTMTGAPVPKPELVSRAQSRALIENLLFECLTSTMKCEYNEEDNERSEILPLSIAVSTLKPSSLSFIKEEIKNAHRTCSARFTCLEEEREGSLADMASSEARTLAQLNGVSAAECFSGIEVQSYRVSRGPYRVNMGRLGLEKKNEPDCHANQLKLESTIEPILHYIIKPEITSKSPAIGGCEELDFKEELCFDESSINCFKLNGKLKTHLIIHGEHRRLKCDVCGKCFKEKDTLKTHLVSHSEHKPHKCDVCGKIIYHYRVVQNIHLLSAQHGYQQVLSVNYRAEVVAPLLSLVRTTLLSQVCEIEPPSRAAQYLNSGGWRENCVNSEKRDLSRERCFRCNKFGHFQNQYPTGNE
uniref:C2H2-type domain-containing protein n=1 Tax=Timema genevievae TaxID=629358 RepID=A0A7R9K684_TIMGE|nr:unnamed protein product [Timema genevievae]